VKRLVLLVGVVAAVLLQPSPASAAWLTHGQARVTAIATHVEKATAPTVVPDGSAADLTWAPVTLKTGEPATGYVVVKDVGAQTKPVCVTDGARFCTDLTPEVGQQTYRVYARFGPWTGPSSAGTTFSPDTQPPTTTATPNGPGWVTTSPVRVTLAATDNLSGVASVSYRIDSGAWTTVNGAVAAFDVAGQGAKTITYRATDNVGNEETLRTLVLHVDSIAPVVSPRSPNLQNGNKWSRVCTDQGLPAGLCGTASDASAISQVTYEVRYTDGFWPVCWDGRRWGTCGYRPATGTSTWSIPLPWDELYDGHYEVRIRATDVAGNTNNTVSATYTFIVP
jgi:hypothetical protein